MYSLLLVDDERTILEGLYHNIDWEETGFSNVYKAASAAEALDILALYRIDVVVSDIRMPGMSGIDMCRRVRESWPQSRIIFLSGYREFDYAQQAVELGIYQYLLKPVSYEELQEAVSGALAQAITDMRQRDLLLRAEERLGSMQTLLLERFLSSWLLQGTLDPAMDTQALSSVGLSITPDMHGFTLLVAVPKAREGIAAPVLQVGIHTLAEALCSGYTHLFCLPAGRGQMLIAFLCIDQHDAARLRLQCANRLDTFQCAVEENMGCLPTLSLGPIARAGDLHTSFHAASQAIYRAPQAASGQILLANSLTGPDPFARMQTLEEALRTLDANAAQAWLDGAFEYKQGAAWEMRQVVTELVGAIMRDAVARDALDRDMQGKCAALLGQDAAAFGGLAAACANLLRGYLEAIAARQAGQRRGIVDAVRSLVTGHLAEGITVNAIAQAMHYNPAYLSRLIKQETGQTLVDMLIAIRMDEACRLLSEGHRVQEVAQAVGYDNLAHFSRTFKKKLGINPSQYSIHLERKRSEKRKKMS